jgi:hypothetical protein
MEEHPSCWWTEKKSSGGMRQRFGRRNAHTVVLRKIHRWIDGRADRNVFDAFDRLRWNDIE